MKTPGHDNFMLENEISIHENDIFMHENETFAPGIVFSPQKVSWVIGLYTTFMHGIITHEMQIFYLQKHFLEKN